MRTDQGPRPGVDSVSRSGQAARRQADLHVPVGGWIDWPYSGRLCCLSGPITNTANSVPIREQLKQPLGQHSNPDTLCPRNGRCAEPAHPPVRIPRSEEGTTLTVMVCGEGCIESKRCPVEEVARHPKDRRLLRSLCGAGGYVASRQIPRESKAIGVTERHITKSACKERKKVIKDTSSRQGFFASSSSTSQLANALAFISRSTSALVSQRLGPLEELLEHSRTSENGEGMGSQFDYAMFPYVAQDSG